MSTNGTNTALEPYTPLPDTSMLAKGTRERIPFILDKLLVGESHEQIAASLGVCRNTVARDLAAWYRSPDFPDWITENWVKLTNQLLRSPSQENKREVLRCLTRMIERKAPTAQVNLTHADIRIEWVAPQQNRKTYDTTCKTEDTTP